MHRKFRRFLTILIVTVAAVFSFSLLAGCFANETELYFYIDEDNGQLVQVKDGEATYLGRVMGNDAEGITIQDVYAFYKESANNPSLTYNEFLDLFLNFDLLTDNSNSINSCLRSAVKVFAEFPMTTYVNKGHGLFDYQEIKYVELVEGSGIVYDTTSSPDYIYFVTNYHVVYESGTTENNKISGAIHIYLYGSESEPDVNNSNSGYVTEYGYDEYAIECDYVGGSLASDIAVLKALKTDVYAVNDGVVPVEFADVDEYGSYLTVGETCFTIGNSEGMGLSVTQGIISVDSETIQLNIAGEYLNYRSIRIDTAVYSGNSGGGLFNKYGKLIGIVNAGNTSDEAINYAVPLSIAKGTADNIIYFSLNPVNGKFKSCAYTPTIDNMTLSSKNSKYVYDDTTKTGRIEEDVVVSYVTANGFQAELGIESGDIIRAITVNAKTTNIIRSYQILELNLTLRPGDMISYTYERVNEDGSTKLATTDEKEILEDLFKERT